MKNNLEQAWTLPLGANFTSQRTVRFRVWAPYCSKVQVRIRRKNLQWDVPLQKDENDYFEGEIDGIFPGDFYNYVLDGSKERPDPVSRYQPLGVHGPSAILRPSDFVWNDKSWKGLDMKDCIFYEIHIGLFTQEGTFEAAIKKIPYLKNLGVTCVEIMPVAQFPGTRNWGYDGVNLYAVQNSYGGPEGFKKFINACHQNNLNVCLDVVYNHWGPEGNYLADFGPYCTDKHATQWGQAVNYDDRGAKGVRDYIVNNALYWVTEYHLDALRLDAIQSITDRSPVHILKEMNQTVQKIARQQNRSISMIAESDLNDSKIIRPEEQGGYGLAAQWSDDFHHALHAQLTSERNGYYRDFGGLRPVAKAVREGFVYDGIYSVFRGRIHGNTVRDLDPGKLVVCIQNHDQIGNRAQGERLNALVAWEQFKLASVLLLLSPNTPLLFMGQEYGETAPFLYFVDFDDPKLNQAVMKGRREEFSSFGFNAIPDPSLPQTFESSRLNWEFLRQNKPAALYRMYQDLIALRKKYLKNARLTGVELNENRGILSLFYKSDGEAFELRGSFSAKTERIENSHAEDRQPFFNSDDLKYGGKNDTNFDKKTGVLHLAAYTAVFYGVKTSHTSKKLQHTVLPGKKKRERVHLHERENTAAGKI